MNTELQKSIERFQNHMRYVDEVAMVVLKGHLLIEEALTRIIEKFIFHPEHLEEAKLSFYQKVHLSRSLCLRKNQFKIWELMLRINSLRNELSHALESDERNRKFERVKTMYLEEMPSSEKSENPKEQPDHIVASYACALCAGFLSSFESDASTFKEIVGNIDSILNSMNKQKQ